MSTNILTFLMVLHVKAAVFAVLMLAIVYSIRRNSSQNRYSVLRMTLGVLTVLPLLVLTLPNYALPFDWWTSPSIDSEATLVNSGATDGELAPLDDPFFSTETLLLIGYSTVSAILLLRMAVGFLRTWKDIRSYCRIDQAQLIALLEQTKQLIGATRVGAIKLGAKWNVELVVDPRGAGPYVWGIGKQVIAVPEEFINAAPDVQRTVLTHELIHIVRRDMMICLAAKVLCSLFWINPALWLLNARLKLEMERSCDDRAVCSGINATDYADHLLNAIQQFDVAHRPHSALAMARASSIKQRIRSLLNNHRQRGIMSTSKSVCICSAVVILGTAIGALAATPDPLPPTEKTRTAPVANQLESANAARAAARNALIDGVKRLIPDNCDASEIRLTTDAIDINGHCVTVSRVSAFLRNLERAGGKPSLGTMYRVADGFDFTMRLTNLESFSPTPVL